MTCLQLMQFDASCRRSRATKIRHQTYEYFAGSTCSGELINPERTSHGPMLDAGVVCV